MGTGGLGSWESSWGTWGQGLAGFFTALIRPFRWDLPIVPLLYLATFFINVTNISAAGGKRTFITK